MHEGIRGNPSAARSIGYREVISYLEAGSSDREALARAIVGSTLSLVKKQMTWFRKQIPVDRVIDLDTHPEGVPPDMLFED